MAESGRDQGARDAALADRLRRTGRVSGPDLQRALEAAAQSRAAGQPATLEQVLVGLGKLSAREVSELVTPSGVALRQSLASGHVRVDAPRRTFGPYELEDELGRGGMGVVYRARDTRSGQAVALKVLLNLQGLEERDRKRFEREAVLAARVRHPGIVAVLAAGTERAIPYVALALVRGRPLSALTLELPRFVEILAKVSRAVGAAHRAKVVHRDLKPSNVIVEDGTGEPCLVDFGLAFDGKLELSRLSRTGEMLGTPAYMAPETIERKGSPDDPRIDTYGLGLMLHEHLAGGHPFRGLSTMQVLSAVTKGIPPLAGRPGVDPTLAVLADRAVAKDPAKRPPDGDAFAAALEDWLRTRQARGAVRSGRAPLVAAGVGLALLSGVAGFVALGSSRSPAPTPTPAPTPAATPTPKPRPAPLVVPEPVVIRPQPPAPATEPRASDATVEAIEGDLLRIWMNDPGAAGRLMANTRKLLTESPHDARTAHFVALGRFMQEDPLGAMRGLVLATRARPSLDDRAMGRTLWVLRSLGRDRAAVGLGERFLFRVPSSVETAQGLAETYVGAVPPVAHAERARDLATSALPLLEGRKNPMDSKFRELALLAARGLASIGTGELPAAAADFEKLAEHGALFSERAALCARPGPDGLDRGLMLRAPVLFDYTPRPFLSLVAPINKSWRESFEKEPAVEAAQRLEEVARDLGGQPPLAALAYQHAARAWRGAREPARALAALEAATALDLAGARDLQALAARALAFALLEQGADPARAAKVAATALEPCPEGETDTRTEDELAEAWALFAWAAARHGDSAAARRALEQAEPLAVAADRRLVERARAELAKSPGP